MLVTKANIVFLTSKRKKTLLEEMAVPADYNGPKL